MKRQLVLFLSFGWIMMLVACGKKADPIVLPQPEKISSVEVTAEENIRHQTDETWIKELIFDLSESEATKKQSIQDFPQVESYIRLDFQLETGTSTLFVYQDNGNYYVEQPYQGIYKIERELFERLLEVFL